MSIPLRPSHLGHYRRLATLLIKYGRSDALRSTAVDGELASEDPTPEQLAEAEHLANDLESMGPTFVKLGQLLSGRVDLLPPAYTTALARLQDDVEPIPFEQVAEIITSELGARLSTLFDDFDQKPLAAASLGQVHRARLRGGRDVVVKVQRPGVRERVMDDMEVLGDIASFVQDHTDTGRRMAVADLLDEFRRSLLDELDYRREASHMRTLAEVVNRRRLVFVPQPFADYTTARVLTMEYVEGRRLGDLGPLGRLEVDGGPLADDLFRAYLDQVLVEGFFHADPHPGNIVLANDGRLALLDVGMVARVTPTIRTQLSRLLVALGESRGEDVARVMADLGTPLAGFDEATFIRRVGDLVARTEHRTLAELEAGALVLELTRVSGDSALRPPPELSMLGKALLNLDQVARILDPSFNPRDSIRRHAADIARSAASMSPGSLFATMLDAKEFAEQLPGRVNRAMDAVAGGRFELRVKAFDETEMLRGVHKAANRVTTGLIVAALILGASLLAQVRSSSEILGYPSIAFLFFVVAAIGGAGLVLSILLSERRLRRRQRDVQ